MTLDHASKVRGLHTHRGLKVDSCIAQLNSVDGTYLTTPS